MVKIPEAAPKGGPSKGFATRFSDVAGELTGIVEKVNRDYLYWDEFKYTPLPDGVRPEDAWYFVKLLRGMSRRTLPVKDRNGRPFTYMVTDDVQRCLHYVDMWAGGWDSAATSSDLPPDESRERYLVSSLMEEAIASSQLEGAATTRKRAREMLLNEETPRDFGERMILNNYRTIRQLVDWRSEPLTPALIVNIQAMLTEGSLRDPEDVGRLRSDDDIIVGDELGRVLYEPPTFTSIPGELERLCQYVNEEPEVFEHPVIRAIAVHFWLALLHPFADGNGRTARSLFYLHMLKQGYWPFEYLSISRAIKSSPAKYQRAYLYAELDDADFTYFLVFNLHVIEQALRDLKSYIARKTKEDARLKDRLAKDFDLNYRQRAVLSRALKNSTAVFTIKSHQASHGVVYATARNDLYVLEARGYLTRMQAGRKFVFMPADDLRERLAGAKRR